MVNTTQQNKKKKKRLESVLLRTDYECLTQDEALRTILEIKKKLREIFKNHIGDENSISPVVLFERVYGVNPLFLDIFKKNYWWNVIKLVIRQLRKDDLFIINKGSKLFVLKTQEECDMFKKRIDMDILRLENTKRLASEWVRKEKWRSL